MPRGRPKKKPADEAGAPAPVAAEPKKPTALELLKQATAEDPKGVVEMLEKLGLVAQGTRRTLDPAEGKRTVSIRKDEVETPVPVPPAEPEPAVIFKSPHPQLRIVAKRGKKVRYGDDYEIIPPTLVEFNNGTARVTDPEDIAAVRARIKTMKSRGQTPIVIEVKDEIAELAKGEVKSVKHDKVTVDTPMEEVLIASEA